MRNAKSGEEINKIEKKKKEGYISNRVSKKDFKQTI